MLNVWYLSFSDYIKILIAFAKSSTKIKSLVYSPSPKIVNYLLFIALSINIDITPVYGDLGF